MKIKLLWREKERERISYKIQKKKKKKRSSNHKKTDYNSCLNSKVSVKSNLNRMREIIESNAHKLTTKYSHFNNKKNVQKLGSIHLIFQAKAIHVLFCCCKIQYHNFFSSSDPNIEQKKLKFIHFESNLFAE